MRSSKLSKFPRLIHGGYLKPTSAYVVGTASSSSSSVSIDQNGQSKLLELTWDSLSLPGATRRCRCEVAAGKKWRGAVRRNRKGKKQNDAISAKEVAPFLELFISRRNPSSSKEEIQLFAGNRIHALTSLFHAHWYFILIAEIMLVCHTMWVGSCPGIIRR